MFSVENLVKHYTVKVSAFQSEKLRAENRYQDYLYLHGFGVEAAEGLAEYWHKRMRQELGFGSEDSPTTWKRPVSAWEKRPAKHGS